MLQVEYKVICPSEVPVNFYIWFIVMRTHNLFFLLPLGYCSCNKQKMKKKKKQTHEGKRQKQVTALRRLYNQCQATLTVDQCGAHSLMRKYGDSTAIKNDKEEV